MNGYDRSVGMVTVQDVETRAPGLFPTGRARKWRAPMLLFAVLLAVFALTSTRGAASTDDHAPAVEAWRIASSGSPWLEDVMTDEFAKDNWLHEVPNGHIVADRMAGPVVLSVPFYWLLDRSSDPGDFSMVPGGFAAAFLTAWTGVLMFLALRRRLGDLLGGAVALAFCLATPTWAVSADGPWTHTVTQFGIAGAAYGASRRNWWLAGLFMGAGIWGRPHLALIATVLGLGMSWTSRSLKTAWQVGLPSLGAVVLLTCWNQFMFGVWSPVSSGYVGHGETLMSGRPGALENFAGFLIAPDRGLLLWTPVLWLLLPAVVRGWAHLPEWSKWLALGGVLYTVAQLRMNVFTGGDSFYAYRLGLELLTCAAPLYAFALPHVGRLGRRALPLVVGVQFAAMVAGSVSEALNLKEEFVWHDNSFVMALRTLPVLFGFLTVVCVAVVVLATRMSMGARPASAAAGDGTGATPPSGVA